MTQVTDPTSGEIIEMAPQDFQVALRMMNYGDVVKALNDSYNELLREVIRLGKGGSLTLKVAIKPVTRGGVTQMGIFPTVSNVLPKQEMAEDLLYLGERGLQREHPRQREIEGLRAVDADNRAARAIEDVEPRTVRVAS